MLTLDGDVEGGLHITSNLSGDLLIGTKTSWPYLMKLAGDIEISGGRGEGDQAITFEGAGPITVERRATYDRVD